MHTLPIAKQTADALEAAHERNIIYRDLKPANIKLRSDGTVKALDFGLARVFEPAAWRDAAMTNSPTLSTQTTLAGVIRGTAASMSPEQASGKPVDKRSDIWSFGVVWEMLTGARLFIGPARFRLICDASDRGKRKDCCGCERRWRECSFQ